jgi:small subunit ribosomal protein S1
MLELPAEVALSIGRVDFEDFGVKVHVVDHLFVLNYPVGKTVTGKVIEIVNAGVLVDIGIEAFAPSKELDIIPSKNLNDFIGNVYEFRIVKVDAERKNVVIPRREIIESEQSKLRQEFITKVKIGDKISGIVKNIKDFGAFFDIEGADCLLHITDMSWGTINHPSEVLHIGQSVDVVILDIDKDKERVALGLKQMSENPWEDIERKYSTGQIVKGHVSKLLPYGAFIEIEPSVLGLVHVSELSWVKKIVTE